MLYELLYPLSEHIQAFNVFKYITFRAIYSTVTALVIALFFGKYFIRKLQEFQIGEQIRADGPAGHHHKSGTPTMGGVLIVFAILVSVALWANFSNPYIWVMVGATLAFGLIGFYDDYLKIARKNSDGFTTKPKFVAQLAISGIIVFAIYTISDGDSGSTIAIPFLKDTMPNLGYWFFPFAMLAIVGTCNAVNLTDGLDGLATGTITITIATLMIILYASGHMGFASYLNIPYLENVGELVVLCGAVFGACLGFLWFNSHPAQIFMGNVGSMALGGLIGTLAVISKNEILLVIIGGVFVAEALSVIIQVGYFKYSGGKRIFLMAPIHHHFEKKGWSESKIVVRFWIIALLLALISLSTLKLR